MLGGDLVEGRNVILQHVNTKVKFRGNQHQYDCYGNEHSNFLSIFKNISKIIVVPAAVYFLSFKWNALDRK